MELYSRRRRNVRELRVVGSRRSLWLELVVMSSIVGCQKEVIKTKADGTGLGTQQYNFITPSLDWSVYVCCVLFWCVNGDLKVIPSADQRRIHTHISNLLLYAIIVTTTYRGKSVLGI